MARKRPQLPRCRFAPVLFFRAHAQRDLIAMSAAKTLAQRKLEEVDESGVDRR